MQKELNLWDFIPSSDFQVPVSPTNEVALDQSRRMWHWFKQFFRQQPEQETSNKSKQHFIPGSSEVETFSSESDWRQAAAALETHLSGWFEKSQIENSNVRILIGPPGSDISSVLPELAQQRQFQILSPPPPETILDDFNSHKPILNLLEELNDEILVIPRLERFYLRQENGLVLLRKMIERIALRRRVLLGCDSWAWEFLQRAIGIEDRLGPPLTIAPFDDQRLDDWFRQSCDLQETEFRQVDDDKPVFPAQPDQTESETKQPKRKTSALIKSLAARARGNLGVALALWRSSLRIERDTEKSVSEKRTSCPVIWVESPNEFESPKPAAGFNQQQRFILHAILLHGGLPLRILEVLMPFSREDVQRQANELCVAGVIHKQHDTLSLSLTSYPHVRQHLVNEDFLTDAF